MQLFVWVNLIRLASSITTKRRKKDGGTEVYASTKQAFEILFMWYLFTKLNY